MAGISDEKEIKIGYRNLSAGLSWSFLASATEKHVEQMHWGLQSLIIEYSYI